MKKLIALVALSVTLSAGSAQAATFTFGDSEYRIITDVNISWTNARAAAQALGAGWDLATVGGEAEDAAIIRQLPTPPAIDRAHYWIGGVRIAVDPFFRWIDSTLWGYTNWHNGEPNNFRENETALAYDFRSTWAWNDVADDLKAAFPDNDLARGFIAERPIPIPAALPLLLAGLAGLGVFARRRAG